MTSHHCSKEDIFYQEELDLSAPNKEAMLSLPLEKKWQIWTSRRGTDQADTNLSNNPEDYTNRLRDLAMVSLYCRIQVSHFYNLLYCSCSFQILTRRLLKDAEVLTVFRLLWGRSLTVLCRGSWSPAASPASWTCWRGWTGRRPSPASTRRPSGVSRRSWTTPRGGLMSWRIAPVLTPSLRVSARRTSRPRWLCWRSSEPCVLFLVATRRCWRRWFTISHMLVKGQDSRALLTTWTGALANIEMMSVWRWISQLNLHLYSFYFDSSLFSSRRPSCPLSTRFSTTVQGRKILNSDFIFVMSF